jgi:raffinose/stachyose/melibiose transport system substrate-binding protein
MKKSKKILAMLLSLVLLASLTAGCQSQKSGGETAASANPSSGASEQSSAAPVKETLRVMTFFAGSDQWAPTWKQVIKDYTDANPNITIVDESAPTAGTNDVFRSKMNSDLAAKTPTDVALFYNGVDAKNMAESGLYVPWDDILAADPEWKNQFSASALDSGLYDGKIYALPYIGFFEGLLYNGKIFADNNLEPPTSWDNIIKAVDVLSKTDIIPIATTLLSPTAFLELFILAQAGAEGQANYFDASWAPALDAVKTLYEMNAFPKDAATISDNDTRTLFADGRAAMSFNGSWVLNALKDNPDMRIIAMPALPGGKGGEDTVVAGFGSGWYLSEDAYKRSGEALKFVKYMCSPEILAKFIAVGGSAAMNIQLPDKTDPLTLSAVEMINKAKYMRPPIDSQISREAFNKLSKDLVYVCVGQKTSMELLEEAKKIEASAGK